MGKYVNDKTLFRKFLLLCEDDLYVNKTKVIEKISRLKKSVRNRYFCVSRPRRFGKTSLLQMISSYYCKESIIDESEFKYIDEDLKQYNVITINMTYYGSSDFSSWLDNLCSIIITELKELFPDYCNVEDDSVKYDIDYYINRIQANSDFEEKFIILIDEWDNPIRNLNLSKKEEYKLLSFYNMFTKGSSNIDLCILFGIYPKSGYAMDSLSNNFKDYSIISDKVFYSSVGFTHEELVDLVNRSGTKLKDSDIEEWYNGYTINGESVMNSNSVLSALDNESLESYCENTSDFNNLLKILVSNEELCRKMISGERVEFNSEELDKLIRCEDFESATSLVYKLIYSGFLSLKDNFIRIPNREMLSIFLIFTNIVKNSNQFIDLLKQSNRALECIFSGKEDELGDILRYFHGLLCASRYYNNEVSLHDLITFIFMQHMDKYHLHKEMNSGEGFIDRVIVAKDSSVALIIECKVEDDTKKGIKQIVDKKYITDFTGYDRVILVSVSYGKKNKIHKCKINDLGKVTHKDLISGDIFMSTNLF